MGQDGSTLEAILLMLREICIFQKMVFRLGGSAILGAPEGRDEAEMPT